MLSVIVITKNEEDKITACLESVRRLADEIIIADNGSQDNTLKIAKEYTDKIFIIESLDFTNLRNKALEKTRGDWVLYIDSDERVLEPLKEEILQLITKDSCSAYAVSRRNIIFGQEEKYGPFWPDWVIRLFKKADFETWVGVIHEYGKFKGKLGYTKNSLLHLTHRNLDQIVLKSLSWSTIDARLRQEAYHPPVSGWRILRILIFELFNQGIRKKGFLSGTRGVMDALLQTFSLVMTYIRLWEMQQPKPLEQTYQDIDKKLIEDGFRF